MTRVLGLDPGTLRFGWGVAEKIGTRLTHVAHGIVRMKDGLPLPERLVTLETELMAVIETWKPNEASMEALFFHKDPQAAAKLGHARGVAMLVCARAGLEVAEYPPARVKLTVAGNGRAEKSQVAQMMRVILHLAEAPKADGADALACAVTHLQSHHALRAMPIAQNRVLPPPYKKARRKSP